MSTWPEGLNQKKPRRTKKKPKNQEEEPKRKKKKTCGHMCEGNPKRPRGSQEGCHMLAAHSSADVQVTKVHKMYMFLHLVLGNTLPFLDGRLTILFMTKT
jgi:hypothetical protein